MNIAGPTSPGLRGGLRAIPTQPHLSMQSPDLKERLGNRTVHKAGLQGFQDKGHLNGVTQEGSWCGQKKGAVLVPAGVVTSL